MSTSTEPYTANAPGNVSDTLRFPRSAAVVVALIALTKLILHLATDGRYGYFRDELYYIACSRHLDWGYVDEPPLISLVTWLELHIGGSSLHSLRFLPAIAGAALAVLAAFLAHYDWDWTTAEREYRRAIGLNPNYATAHHWYSEYLTWRGRFDEALRDIDIAGKLDPLSLVIANDRAVTLYYARDYDRAIEQFRYVRDMDPNFPRSNMIAAAYVRNGMMSEAMEEVKKWRPGSPWYWSFLAYLHALAGDRAQARLAQESLLRLNRQAPVDTMSLVIADISVGDYDRALTLMERASKVQANSLISLKVDPYYDPLRADPRFQALTRRVGL